MKYLKYLLLLILILALLLPLPHWIRAYSFVIVLIILIILIASDKKKKNATKVLLISILLLSSYSMDIFVTYIFNTSPVLTLKINEYNNTTIYNSIFYRVWKCDNKVSFDAFYDDNYLCNTEDLKIIDANVLLSSIVENYNDYKNEFIKVSGKISNINGSNTLTISSYENSTESLNGNVIFSNAVNLKVIFKKTDISSYSLYDDVTVIGRVVSKRKEDNSFSITMKDAIINPNIDYSTYELNVTKSDKCEKDKTLYATKEKQTFYKSCIDKIYVKYNDKNIYELSYSILENKITLDDLLKDAKEIDAKDVTTLYKTDKYNLLVCNNETKEGDIIIGNNSLTIDNNYCIFNDDTE